MTTAQELREHFKELDDIEYFLGRKEIYELPQILWHDEKPEKIVQGYYAKGSGVLVATNKRLIFIDKGLLWGLKVEDFPYDKISSIQFETGLITGKITIFTSGNKAEIENIKKEKCAPFCNYTRARITGIKENASAKQDTKTGSDDIITKLERLATLKAQGILTEDEFLAAKQKILNS